MADKKWKRKEREIARSFGTFRSPLSGSNSRHTTSDTLHPLLYIEHKHRKAGAIHTLFQEVEREAKKEKKVPVVTLTFDKMKGTYLVCKLKDAKQVVKWLE